MHNNKCKKANYTYATVLYILAFLFVSCKNKAIIAVPLTNKLYQIKDDSSIHQSSVDTIMKDYLQHSNVIMQEAIGTTALPLTFAQPESSLGNLLADAVWNYFENKQALVDMVALSPQIIGLYYLAPGTITIQNCIQLIPKDNELFIVSLTGLQVQQLTDSIASMNGIPIAGCTIKIKSKKSATILIAAQRPKEQLLYQVCFNEDLYKQRAFRFLQNINNAHRTNISLRNVLIAYMRQLDQKRQMINATLEQRISYE